MMPPVTDALAHPSFHWYVEQTSFGPYPFGLECRNDTPSPIWLGPPQRWWVEMIELGPRVFWERTERLLGSVDA